MLLCNAKGPNFNSEGIRHFQVSKDKLASTFRLLRVKDLPEWANTNAVSISDVIQVRVLYLFYECPVFISISIHSQVFIL